MLKAQIVLELLCFLCHQKQLAHQQGFWEFGGPPYPGLLLKCADEHCQTQS